MPFIELLLSVSLKMCKVWPVLQSRIFCVTKYWAFAGLHQPVCSFRGCKGYLPLWTIVLLHFFVPSVSSDAFRTHQYLLSTKSYLSCPAVSHSCKTTCVLSTIKFFTWQSMPTGETICPMSLGSWHAVQGTVSHLLVWEPQPDNLLGCIQRYIKGRTCCIRCIIDGHIYSPSRLRTREKWLYAVCSKISFHNTSCPTAAIPPLPFPRTLSEYFTCGLCSFFLKKGGVCHFIYWQNHKVTIGS